MTSIRKYKLNKIETSECIVVRVSFVELAVRKILTCVLGCDLSLYMEDNKKSFENMALK